MNKQLAGLLMPYVAGLPFADLVGGLAQTISTGGRSEVKGAAATPVRRFPASTTVAAPYQVTSVYQDLTPNDKYKSVTFFEGYDCRVVNRERGLINLKSIIRIACWLNTKKVQMTDVEALIKLLAALPEGFINGNGLVKVKIADTKVLDAGIFNRYTFDETVRQYLMMPFQAFALELEITYSVNPTDPVCQ